MIGRDGDPQPDLPDSVGTGLWAWLENAPVAVLAVARDGRIVLANAHTAPVFGYAPEELVGAPVEMLVPARFRAAHAGHRAAFAAHPRDRAYGSALELRGLRKDGSEFDADIALWSVATDQGDLATVAVREVSPRTVVQRRLAQLLEAAPDAFVGIDAAGVMVFVNGQTESVFGYERGALLGEPVEMLLPGAFRAAHREHRLAYFADPRVRTMGDGLELRGRRSDGSEFPAAVSLSSIETDQGPVAMAAVRDITVEVRRENEAQRVTDRVLAAERDLRESQDHLSELLGNAPVPIALADRDGRFVAVNHASATLLGTTVRGAVGRTPADLFEGETLAMVEARHREVLDGGRAVTYEVTARDGARYQTTRYPVVGPDGQITGVGSIALDITERARADAIAKQLAAIIESTDDAVIGKTPDGRVLSWNPAAERIYGYSRQEAVGRHISFLLPPGQDDEIPAIMSRLAAGERIGQLETVRRHKDGRVINVSLTMSSITDADGVMIGASTIARDITERLEAQAERERLVALAEREQASARLERSQRLESLGQLAGGVAHDFNNLLGIIIGYAGMVLNRVGKIQDEIADDQFDGLSSDLGQIAHAGERAAALTHQLLAFARQDTVTPAVIDVNDTITELLELLRRTLGPHIELTASLDPDVHRVLIDPGQLSQIMINLAVNSREAMATGGRLEIQTTRAHFDSDRTLSHGVLPAGSYVRIRVSDNGAGMEPEVVAHAVEPFFTTREVGEGTGLGLATVYGIATHAGGQIEIYSEPGHGTTVAVLLPATDAPTTESPPPPADIASPITIRTVLIVDDEPALGDVTAYIVAEAGYSVLVARNGPDAVSLAQPADQPIDLLLTDVVMPGLPGQELAAQLRASRPGLRVVFMSGFARPFLPGGGQSLHGRLLQKPFTDTELLSTMADALSQPAED